MSEKKFKTFVEIIFERYFVNAIPSSEQELAIKSDDSFYVRYVPGRKKISGYFIQL